MSAAEALQRVELFQNLFYLSLTLAGIGLGLAIFFFFFFDIREIYMIRSGKAKQNAVEDMTQRSARNGRLRRMNKQPQKQSSAAAPAPAPAPAPAAAATPAATMDTMPLKQQTSAPAAEETTYLNERAITAPIKDQADHYEAETTELLTRPQAENVPAPCGFVLTENTILIHTNEII